MSELTRDVVEELERRGKREENDIIKTFGKLSPNILIIIFIGSLLVINAYYSDMREKNPENPKLKQEIYVYAVFGSVIMWIILTQHGTPKVLSEPECKRKLHEVLRFKQEVHYPGTKYRELPYGELKMGLAGKLQYLNGKPWKRSLAFSIIDTDSLEHHYSAELNAYTADIIKIKPGMLDVDDVLDIETVFVPWKTPEEYVGISKMKPIKDVINKEEIRRN